MVQMRPPQHWVFGLTRSILHLKNFPTQYHSNYQWFDLLDWQQVMWLDGFPSEIEPSVQPIDLPS